MGLPFIRGHTVSRKVLGKVGFQIAIPQLNVDGKLQKTAVTLEQSISQVDFVRLR